jgi:hypothetical protein
MENVRLFYLIIFNHIFNNILIPANVQILLPYSLSMAYPLFVLDHTERTPMMFDTSPIKKCFQEIPYKRFVKKNLNIKINYAQAVKHVCQMWFEDIFLWRHVPIEDTPVVDR